MFAALAQTAIDLGVGLLIAGAVFAGLLLLGIFLGHFIRGPVTPEFAPSDLGEPKDAEDLDDWLGQDGLDFNFRIYREPKASVRVGGTDGLR
jgi:hypothetical protein